MSYYNYLNLEQTSPIMDERHQEMFNHNFADLVEKTVNIELLIDELVSRGTITKESSALIRDTGNEEEMTKVLYRLLPKAGPEAYDSLLDAFHVTGNENVALILKENRLCNQSPTGGLSPSSDSDNDFEEKYRMKTSPRGVVLIINVHEFDDDYRERRDGSEKDVSDLRSLFEDLGFQVMEENSGTKVEIEGAIKKWKNHEKMSKVDCGILILMSHGNEGPDPGTVRISTKDKKVIDSEWIIENMSAANAPRLHGKPKLIFILTCRGDYLDFGADLDKLKELQSLRPKQRQLDAAPWDQFDGYPRSSASLRDVLLIYPCAPGKASHRSWFVQEMCNVFRRKAHKDDVETMLKEMDRNLGKQPVDYFQIICTTGRGFWRKLFLNPAKPLI